jgi:glyoxylase-like metal-dependent hydrolase (beta-lactamase superfamily II)
MAPEIHSIRLGIDKVYLIKQQCPILIDGGEPGHSERVKPGLVAAGVSPNEIKLIILTHGHWDHIGCAAYMKKLTGAPLAMHDSERERIEKPIKVHPPAVTRWGKVVEAYCNAVLVRPARIEPATVNISIPDEGMSLQQYGVDGQIVHTPGHSPGSLTVLLASGDAFVGDLAVNMFPLRFGPGLPIFAECMSRIKSSIERLIALGATTIHPAHGSTFPVEILKKAASRL